jgi:hypothetical protein
MLQLDEHDQALVALVRSVIDAAVTRAHAASAVAKRITTLAVRHRNRGRRDAARRHPFRGICEASGLPLAQELAVLDELDPESGYSGRVRWGCHRANNSGKHSCGGCR